MCSCRLAEVLTPGSTTGTAATSRSRCPGTGPAGQFTKTAGLPLTLESVTGPYFAEKVPEVGHSLPPAAFVNLCVTKAMTLPLLDAAPEMDAALTEQVMVEVPNLTVTVISSPRRL
jgi:hypothetical protein